MLTPTESPKAWTIEEVVITEPAIIRRAIAAASVGNITEWYDFGVYAYFEPYIQKVFFANLSPPSGPSPPSACSQSCS